MAQLMSKAGNFIVGTVTTNLRYSIEAASIKPFETNGFSGVNNIEMDSSAATSPNLWYCACDKDADQYGQITLDPADEWDAGTITVSITWSHPAASSFDCMWAVDALSVGNDDSFDQNWGTQVTSLDSGGTTHDMYTTADMEVTASNATAGNVIIIRVGRLGSNGSDDLNVDAWLVSVNIEMGSTRSAF